MSDLISLLQPPAFHADALCKEYPPDWFFPTEKGNNFHVRRAQRICEQCAVQAECAAWALDQHEMYGVWGGLSERNRKDIWAGRTPRVLRPLAPCGTYGAYERHRRRGEQIDQACWDAMQAKRREIVEKRQRARAG